jgi:hypothetical protein
MPVAVISALGDSQVLDCQRTKDLGIALSRFGRLDDPLRYDVRDPVGSIANMESDQRVLVCESQLVYLFLSKR